MDETCKICGGNHRNGFCGTLEYRTQKHQEEHLGHLEYLRGSTSWADLGERMKKVRDETISFDIHRHPEDAEVYRVWQEMAEKYKDQNPRNIEIQNDLKMLRACTLQSRWDYVIDRVGPGLRLSGKDEEIEEIYAEISRDWPEKKNLAFLEQFDNLVGTLENWLGSVPYEAGQEFSPLSWVEVQALMRDNKEVREAIRFYLGFGGDGYKKDYEIALQLSQGLAWGLVEEFEGNTESPRNDTIREEEHPAASPESHGRILGSIEGLTESLYIMSHRWVPDLQDKELPLSYEQIVTLVADDKVVRASVLAYLREVDIDAANDVGERLAWDVVAETEKRKSNQVQVVERR